MAPRKFTIPDSGSQSTSHPSADISQGAPREYEQYHKQYSDIINRFWGELTKLNDKVTKLNKDLAQKEKQLNEAISSTEKKFEQKISTQLQKHIEVLGVFSALLALIISNINLAAKVDDYSLILVLIIASTCCFVVFIVIIHCLFTANEHYRIPKPFYWACAIITLLLLTSVITNSKLSFQSPISLNKATAQQTTPPKE